MMPPSDRSGKPTTCNSTPAYFPSPPFFFNDTTPTEISTLPLPDALPTWGLVAAEPFLPVNRSRFSVGARHDAAVRQIGKTNNVQLHPRLFSFTPFFF